MPLEKRNVFASCPLIQRILVDRAYYVHVWRVQLHRLARQGEELLEGVSACHVVQVELERGRLRRGRLDAGRRPHLLELGRA